MKKELKTPMDIVNELNDIENALGFMTHATVRIAEDGCAISDELLCGMQNIFWGIEARIKAVGDVLETANLTLGGVR